MKKKKLLLVSANRYAVPYPVYPLGISYIHSYLKERLTNFDFQVIDFHLHKMEDFRIFLENYQPDYTAVSLRNVDDVSYTSQEFFLPGYKEITDLIRETVRTTMIIGGAAFSIFPRELFEYFSPDYGIYGEGEESLYQLLKSLESGNPDLSIEGLVYRKKDVIIINIRRNYLRSLNLSFSPELIDFYWQKSGMMNVQTKRGCPYKCIYCTYPLLEGSSVRTLNSDKIVETLQDLYFNRKVTYVFFTDSVFNIDTEFNIELAEKILRSGIRMQWGAYFSPHHVTREELKLFQRSGLTHIEFGTESLSDQTLRKYKKHFTVDEIVEISQR